MSKIINDFEIDIPCPKCSYKNKEKYSRLIQNPQLTCPNCQQTIDIEADELKARIENVEKQLQSLVRKLSK